MKEWNGILNTQTSYQPTDWNLPDQTVLFDIETTGLSPKNSMLYFIGFCYYQDSVWHYRMLFNDDSHSEHKILQTFLDILTSETTLVHYNGDSFDLPYLTVKCEQYASLGLPLTGAAKLQDCTSLDLYKVIQPYRNGLSLPNLKLQTLEQAMHISRSDHTHGGELIRVYHAYEHSGDARLEQILFQHNFDDVQAMIPLLQLLSFRFLSQGLWILQHTEDLGTTFCLSFCLTHALPLEYTLSASSYILTGSDTSFTCQLPVKSGELRYYLPDWKDYYYLPVEDTVIHKSIAAYVDSPYKERAKKQNAYIKKSSRFLPYPGKKAPTPLHLYHTDEKSSDAYIDLAELVHCQPAFWDAYIKQLL